MSQQSASLPEGIDPVACYFGQRIIDGAFTYEYAVSKWSKYTAGIVKYLEACKRTDLIPNYQPPTQT